MAEKTGWKFILKVIFVTLWASIKVWSGFINKDTIEQNSKKPLW
jgi:hypothetical protein